MRNYHKLPAVYGRKINDKEKNRIMTGLEKDILAVLSSDARMTAKREADGLQLDVACDSARGRGYRAELK